MSETIIMFLPAQPAPETRRYTAQRGSCCAGCRVVFVHPCTCIACAWPAGCLCTACAWTQSAPGGSPGPGGGADPPCFRPAARPGGTCCRPGPRPRASSGILRTGCGPSAELGRPAAGAGPHGAAGAAHAAAAGGAGPARVRGRTGARKFRPRREEGAPRFLAAGRGGPCPGATAEDSWLPGHVARPGALCCHPAGSRAALAASSSSQGPREFLKQLQTPRFPLPFTLLRVVLRATAPCPFQGARSASTQV